MSSSFISWPISKAVSKRWNVAMTTRNVSYFPPLMNYGIMMNEDILEQHSLNQRSYSIRSHYRSKFHRLFNQRNDLLETLSRQILTSKGELRTSRRQFDRMRYHKLEQIIETNRNSTSTYFPWCTPDYRRWRIKHSASIRRGTITRSSWYARKKRSMWGGSLLFNAADKTEQKKRPKCIVSEGEKILCC